MAILTIGFTHLSWWHVFCLLPSDLHDKAWGEKKGQENENKNKDMTRGKGDFLPCKKYWRTIEAKKSENINNWKNKRLKERNLKNIIFYIRTCLFKKKKERITLREMACCNTCPAAEINENWMPHAIVHACEYRNNGLLQEPVFILEEIKWFFCSKYVSSSKKSSQKMYLYIFFQQIP